MAEITIAQKERDRKTGNKNRLKFLQDEIAKLQAHKSYYQKAYPGVPYADLDNKIDEYTREVIGFERPSEQKAIKKSTPVNFTPEVFSRGARLNKLREQVLLGSIPDNRDFNNPDDPDYTAKSPQEQKLLDRLEDRAADSIEKIDNTFPIGQDGANVYVPSSGALQKKWDKHQAGLQQEREAQLLKSEAELPNWENGFPAAIYNQRRLAEEAEYGANAPAILPNNPVTPVSGISERPAVGVGTGALTDPEYGINIPGSDAEIPQDQVIANPHSNFDEISPYGPFEDPQIAFSGYTPGMTTAPVVAPAPTPTGPAATPTAAPMLPVPSPVEREAQVAQQVQMAKQAYYEQQRANRFNPFGTGSGYEDLQQAYYGGR